MFKRVNGKLQLRFDIESAFALRQEPATDANWQKWIAESVAGVASIRAVLKRQNVGATFFVVGLLLDKAGHELADLLKEEPLFDVESHTFTHCGIAGPCRECSVAEFREDLAKTSTLILHYFGKKPIGFCAPGNFYRGLRGEKELLQLLWDEGYRFLGTDGVSKEGPPFPAPFTQPYWYTEEGFPDLLELPVTGWHCNLLSDSGCQNNNWRPAQAFPDGTVLEKLPSTFQEVFEVREKEFNFAIENNLVYAPAMHPWSLFRFDPEMKHLELLIEQAKENNIPIVNCLQEYEEYKSNKS